MSELDEARARIQREKDGAPVVSQCVLHGDHLTVVCEKCYGVQQERVERESLPLRMANTCEAMRARVLAQLSVSNGHAHG